MRKLNENRGKGTHRRAGCIGGRKPPNHHEDAIQWKVESVQQMAVVAAENVTMRDRESERRKVVVVAENFVRRETVCMTAGGGGRECPTDRWWW